MEKNCYHMVGKFAGNIILLDWSSGIVTESWLINVFAIVINFTIVSHTYQAHSWATPTKLIAGHAHQALCRATPTTLLAGPHIHCTKVLAEPHILSS